MSEYPEEYAEIDGRIYLQARLLMPQGTYPESGKVFSLLIFDVQHKLRAMLYHKGNFLHIENAVIQTCIDQQTPKAQIPHNLYFEFEAFLFQTKSALDITIKLLGHLFPNTFRVHTFHNKGRELIAKLEQYKGKLAKQFAGKIENQEELDLAIEYRSSTVDNIISMLEDDRSSWLSKAIDCRDTISHFNGSFNLGEYTVERTGEEYRITLPKILRNYPRQFMEITYRNCIEFIQDFICLFIELWLPPLFAITAASDSEPTLASWKEANVAAAKYIKYTLGIRQGA
jgi:hypothetical protein